MHTRTVMAITAKRHRIGKQSSIVCISIIARKRAVQHVPIVRCLDPLWCEFERNLLGTDGKGNKDVA